MNLPDAIKQVENALQALADAASIAEADSNLPKIASDLKTAWADIRKAIGDLE